jgi:hypothetical protein
VCVLSKLSKLVETLKDLLVFFSHHYFKKQQAMKPRQRNILVAVAITAGVVAVVVAIVLYTVVKYRNDHNKSKFVKLLSGPFSVDWTKLGFPQLSKEQARMWLSLGSQIVDALPTRFDGSVNKSYSGSDTRPSPYYQLMKNDISKTPLTCSSNDLTRAQFLAYFKAVYPHATRFENLTTAQLQGAYRTLKWFYVVSPEDQPDGGFNGAYWKDRIVAGNDHDANTGCTTTTARANMGLLFDEIRVGGSKGAKSSKNFWGQFVFLESHQASMRRGCRNTRQVLEQQPSWLTNGQAWRYGNGGFPEFSYVETSQFPEEHALSSSKGQQNKGYGFPTACDAAGVVSNKAAGAQWFHCMPGYKGNCTDLTKPLYQPPFDSADWGPKYQGPKKPIWLYFDKGFGLFRNMGRIIYSYSYMDFFLNAPKGLGWSYFTFAGREHDINDPVYSMKLILEYLSRTAAVPASCTDTTTDPKNPKKYTGPVDPRTGGPGLGYCVSPCCGMPGAESCTSKACMSVCCTQEDIEKGKSIGTKRSVDKQVAALMGVASFWAPYTATTTAPSSWPAACVKTNATPAPVYATRKLGETHGVDNRYLVTGWVNGHFYGFPKGDCLCSADEYRKGECFSSSSSKYVTSAGKLPQNCSSCNAYRGDGIAGVDPETGDIIYGKVFSEKNPLRYYDFNGKLLYETWGGKPLAMDEETALALVAEFYSCGDTGAESANYNWPFGCYFAYGQDLGGPGKYACTQAANANPGYAVTTWHFTATPLSYDSETMPAYDYEIMLNQVNQGDFMPEGTAECAMAVSLDVTASDDDLRTWACSNMGSTGGYVMVDSPAGRTAVPFKGTDMGVSNYTTLDPPTFYYDKPNTFSGKSNVLNAKSYCTG